MPTVPDVPVEAHDPERLADMRTILEEPNVRLLQQLLASDSGALSPREVAWRNTGSLAESTVRDHLAKLVELGFAKKLTPDVETIPNTMPRTYYAASPYTIELMKQMGIWDGLGILYQMYDAMEPPDDIKESKEWEGRPQPEWLQPEDADSPSQ